MATNRNPTTYSAVANAEEEEIDELTEREVKFLKR
jgi:hypothetical protein